MNMPKDMDLRSKKRSITAPITNRKKGQKARESQKFPVQAKREYEK